VQHRLEHRLAAHFQVARELDDQDRILTGKSYQPTNAIWVNMLLSAGIPKKPLSHTPRMR